MESDFIADIRMARTDQGGRAGPILPSSFSCIMVLDGSNHDVRLQLTSPLSPGKKRRVSIVLLDPNVVRKLHLGSNFVLREVRRIATGTVVEVRATHPVA